MPEQPTETPETAPAPEAQAEPSQQDQAQQFELAMANQRAQNAEQLAWEANRRAEQAAQAAAQANRPQFVDPLDRLSKDDMIMTPDEKKRHLAAAIEIRANAMARQQDQHFEQRLAQERQAMEAQMAMNAALATRPELNDPRNMPNFAASVAKAKMIADSQGQNISYGEIVRRAGQVYDTDYGQAKRQNVPFVEGAQRPDMSNALQPQANAGPPEKNRLEKMYGRKVGSIQELPDDWQGDNLAYLKAKNKPLFDRGAQTNLEEIRATVTE